MAISEIFIRKVTKLFPIIHVLSTFADNQLWQNYSIKTSTSYVLSFQQLSYVTPIWMKIKQHQPADGRPTDKLWQRLWWRLEWKKTPPHHRFMYVYSPRRYESHFFKNERMWRFLRQNYQMFCKAATSSIPTTTLLLFTIS